MQVASCIQRKARVADEGARTGDDFERRTPPDHGREPQDAAVIVEIQDVDRPI